MNNELEQIAQQNEMSIEFVTWFFDKKKSACGEHWFLALGAMWEGWNACCAAMLQAGHSPVIPDGYVMVLKESTEAILDEFDSIIDYGA